MYIKNFNFSLLLIFSMLMACGNNGSKSKVNAESVPINKEESPSALNAAVENNVKTQEKSKDVDSKDDDVTEKKNAKNSSTDQQDDGVPPEQIKKAKEIIKGVKKKQIAEVDSKKKFKMHCATCHGFKGNMKINGAKKLSASKISLEESVAQIYFGKGLMTPYKDILSEVELVAVAKYIEGLRK